GERDPGAAVSAARGPLEVRAEPHPDRRPRHARRVVRTALRPEAAAGLRHARRRPLRARRARRRRRARRAAVRRRGAALDLDADPDLPAARLGVLRHRPARRAGGRDAGGAARTAAAPRRDALRPRTMSVKRGLFVAHAYPRPIGDAAGSFLHRLALALQAHGVRVRVLAPSAPKLPPTETLEGIEIHRFRYAPAGME